MAQFDVHRYRSAASDVRYVVDVQNDLLSDLATRLVVPAYPLDAESNPISRLNPLVEIGGTRHYLAVQEMAAIRCSSLGAVEGSLRKNRDAIIAAIDVLVTGV